MNAFAELLRPRSRTRLEPKPTPSGPPIYAHPGRLQALEKAVALADEVIRLFEDHHASPGPIVARKRELENEMARTVEPDVPTWAADHHAEKLADCHRMIDFNVASSRHTVSQFLEARQPDQAGRYALQLIDLPLRCDREVFG